MKIFNLLRISLFALAAYAGAANPAASQSVPAGIVQSNVWTPGQWAAAFASKQDTLGFSPISPSNLIGATPITVTPSSGVISVGITTTTFALLGRTNTYTSDNYFGSGRPWVDVKAFGAAGNQAGDDGPSIQNAINFLTTNFGGGTVYVPNGNYCVKTSVTSTTNRISFIGESTGVLLQPCGADITPLTLNGFGDTIERLSITGPNITTTTHDALHVGPNCVECRIYNSHFQAGRHAVFNEAPDVSYIDNRLDGSYGGAMFYTSQGIYMLRNKLDQNMVAGNPVFGTYTPVAWTGTHVYAANSIVSDAGFYLQTVSGGTSGSSLPTVLPYSQNITDGTVTWQLLAPVSYYALQIDTGTDSLLSYLGDFSGPFTAAVGITNTLSGSAPSGVVLDGGDFGQNFVAGVWAQVGNNVVINNSQAANCFNVGCSGILFDTGFLGDATVSNTTIFQNAIGINILGGTNYAVLGSKVYASSTSGINVAANLSGFKIIGNDLGVSPVWGANLVGLTIQAGTGNHYTVSGNNFTGATTAINNGATGVNRETLNDGTGIFGVQVTTPIVSGGSAAGSILALKSTTSGSPSGDKITFATGGIVRGTWLSNGNLGLGTETNPQVPLVVSQNAATGLANNSLVGLIAADGVSTSIGADTYANGGANFSSLILRTAGGTGASPSTVTSGNVIGSISGTPFVNGAFAATPARVVFSYTDTSPNTGTSIGFAAIANGSTSRVLQMSIQNGVTIGSTNVNPGVGNLGFVSLAFAGGTVPTLTGFCTSPTVPNNNGSVAFEINVGTSCAASTGTITLPAAAHKWKCDFANVTNPNTNVVRQTGGTTTTATVTNYSATTGSATNFTSSDVIEASCTGY